MQRVFENRMVKETCVRKKDEVPQGWRKLNKEKYQKFVLNTE